MLSAVLCVAAFIVVFWRTRSSLVAGVGAALAVGYAYGIVRANVPQQLSHFTFDAGTGGLYAMLIVRGPTPMQRLRIRHVKGWVICLIGWPMLLFLIPVQDPLVQLVGLRSVIWFVPMLLVGAMMSDEERDRLGTWLAILNLVALGVGLAEFSLGIATFFPHNAATDILYQQNDVSTGEGWAFRIPSTFVSPAVYGATMVMSIPVIIGAWAQKDRARTAKVVLIAGLIAAIVGVFMAASRSQALILFGQMAGILIFAKLRLKHLLAFALVGMLVGYWVYTEPRFQRFTLVDPEIVNKRLQVSVNEDLLDAIADYPLGNGLGGGGTSIPYFLQDRVQNAIFIENEYGRLLLEIGFPGLMMWLAFIVLTLVNAPVDRAGPWRMGWRIARLTCALIYGTAFIGSGLLTEIPGTFLLLFLTGWLTAPKLRPFQITADEAEWNALVAE